MDINRRKSLLKVSKTLKKGFQAKNRLRFASGKSLRSYSNNKESSPSILDFKKSNNTEQSDMVDMVKSRVIRRQSVMKL